jgi:ankyrin repeat protein
MHLVLELMLAVTKKLDNADARGWSPLFYAIQNHSYFVLKELLAKDASPDQREKITGLSPLEYSIQISSRKTIDLLLKKGAQITGQDYHGNNAIMYAAEKFDHKLLIKLYERYKDEFLSQILHKNSNNEMALSFAAQNQNVKAAILLYALGERRYSPAFELNYVLDSSNHLPIEYFNLDAKQIFDCAANKIELFGRKSDWENAEKLDNYTETLYEQCNQKSNY